MLLTETQKRIVTSCTSTAVQAGAGTGKTRTLTERYIYHLNQGFRPLEIAAVTFTEQAAEELRVRIRQTLEARAHTHHHHEQLERWLVEIEAAPIGTLHSLAARICCDFPEEAGVPAGFRILDEVEGPLYEASLVNDVLAHLPEAVYELLPPETGVASCISCWSILMKPSLLFVIHGTGI